MIRSFFAIDLPAPLREEVRRLQAGLRQTGADVRWTRPEGVHLTLKFLGNVAEETLEPLAAAAAEPAARSPVLTLGLAGTGVFPNRSRARVVWVGLKGDVAALGQLQKEIEAVASRFGFAPEKRPFRPHLTLGRVRSNRKRAELLAALERTEPQTLEFTAREVVLFKSDLKPTGAVYTALRRLPLGGTNMEEQA